MSSNFNADPRGVLTTAKQTDSKKLGVIQKALSRLKGRRRLWFVLEEGRLLYYKSEADARSKEPLGAIDIRGSAISLALEEDNQFVVHSNGREHALVAEDHEAMMLWILAIQARQVEPVPESSPSTRRKQSPGRSLQRAHSLQLPPEKRHDTLRRMYTLWEFNGKVVSKQDSNNNGRDAVSSDTDDDTDEESGSERVRLLKKMNSTLRDSSISGVSNDDSAVGSSSSSDRLQELETELICTKCELAKALNRESAYKSIIEEKICLVNELEERLRSSPDGDAGWKSPVRGSLQEKCRVLQNHNRFLNEEVLKLAQMMQHEKKKTESKHQQMRQLQLEVEQLKRDYVFLMQSSLRISNCDGPETIQVYLYGGNRHKERVIKLLEEARRINPTLPVYENMSRGHVDSLGFRRCFVDEALTLHYICRQLHHHYSCLGSQYEHHLQQWKNHLRLNPTLPNSKELKILVRKGIPIHLRSRVWAMLYRSRVNDIIESKGPHYYNFLCSLAPDDERVTHHKRQIALDLLRTMPDNIRFADANADGVRKMQEVLQAFCVHNPALGYCQGMNFLVGMCLLFLEPEDAFWCLVAVTERYFSANYFDQNLIGAQADQEVLKELLHEKMPELWQHFSHCDIELCTVTLNWFLAIFFDCVPFESLLRIWDCFLLEGPKVLFRFSLAILKMNEVTLLAKHDTVSIMRQLKAAAKLCFDVDHLFQISFEVLKPFTRRQEIAAKQACYYKTLKEHAKKMEMEKLARKDREMMLSEMEFLSVNQLVIECAAVYDKDKLWLCHGHQNGAQITKVNCEENIMYRLNIEIESRVMCMHALDDDTMLLGTLSHFVHSYSTKARRLLWETRLNDSVLSLASHEEDGLRQVYAGLADGTVAVIEHMDGPKPETFYILIGSNPVTCLRLVERRLWCGTGNRVVILNARTLDSIDQFHTSSSCLDYLSILIADDRGVWLTIRGSSVLQLWDPYSLTCRLLFDVRDNKYPRSPKVGEEEMCASRITALLPFSRSVLVGTAEGSLIIYDVLTKLSRSPSSAEINPHQKIQLLVHRRMDSGCFSSPLLPAQVSSSPEDRSETTSHDKSDCTSQDRSDSTSQDRSDSASQDRSDDTSHSTVKAVKKLCTCHQLRSVKCRHCLLEASEPLRKLFDKYSLSINSGNHVDYTTRYQNLLNHSQNKSGSRCKEEDNVNNPTSEDPTDIVWSDNSLEYTQSNDETLRKPHTESSSIFRAMSADDVTQWVKSQETSASDSYDYDDVFVAYTEDDGRQATRPLNRRRSLDYSVKTDVWLNDTSSTSSRCLKDNRTQLPKWWSGSEATPLSYENSLSGMDSLPLGDTHKSSETASNISFSSTDVPYAFELNLQEKIKISDKPIKCLLETRCGSEPTIISCAGCYGDDEAVLKWTKVGDEELWTNDPIIEVCPYTNAIKPSPYTRSRLPRRSSSLNTDSTARGSFTSISSSTSSVVGSGLAKVHNIFLRVQDKNSV